MEAPRRAGNICQASTQRRSTTLVIYHVAGNQDQPVKRFHIPLVPGLIIIAVP